MKTNEYSFLGNKVLAVQLSALQATNYVSPGALDEILGLLPRETLRSTSPLRVHEVNVSSLCHIAGYHGYKLVLVIGGEPEVAPLLAGWAEVIRPSIARAVGTSSIVSTSCYADLREAWRDRCWGPFMELQNKHQANLKPLLVSFSRKIGVKRVDLEDMLRYGKAQKFPLSALQAFSEEFGEHSWLELRPL